MDQRSFAKHLRKNMTGAERRLWGYLRAKRLSGGKFRRQQPIGPYIVDFVHLGARVIVEADGGQHDRSPSDAIRDTWPSRQGFHVLRFWNNDILAHTDAVLETILKAVGSRPLSPALSREGRGRTAVTIDLRGDGMEPPAP